ncbi:iron-containing redox enzyme family protein [soil metagenome]
MQAALPASRGVVTEAVFDYWRGGPPPLHPRRLARGISDPLTDDDLHLALWACYQLHYGGFRGLDDALEWDPSTLALRGALEHPFEQALREEHLASSLPADARLALETVATWPSPPLARTVEEHGQRWQVQEFAVHRSAYQLKEADAHTWAIPRLKGPGRSAMVRIQADEYGVGAGGAHAELFVAAMEDLDLNPSTGHYIDLLPGVTLATDNLVSMFGLHRRLRGALVGHLALFETCSSVPMSRYLVAAERLGGMPALEEFYRVHVEADVHHADIALNEMVRPLVDAEPELAPEVAFGAAALQRVEGRLARHLLEEWGRTRSSLRQPLLTSVA